MTSYKLKLSYKGQYYKGWQSQVDSGPTIQDTLNLALKSIFKSDEIKSLAAGRTDSGVNAISQVVKIDVPFPIEPQGLLKGINTKLPIDIRVLECEECSSDFHPIADAKSRTYRYYFSNEKIANPLLSGLIYNISYDLNFDLMHNACKLFVGEHDFLDFSCKGSEPQSTVRKVSSCSIKSLDDNPLEGLFPNIYYLELKGNGFLKQMVRAIMGSLIEVGRDKLAPELIEKSLTRPTGGNISIIAPAEGLVKFSVEY